jgi:hypothetical protein
MAGLLVDILMLDIVWVIVVLAVEVVAEILVLQRVSVSWMTASSRFEIVKLVGCVGGIAYSIRVDRSRGASVNRGEGSCQ